MKLNEKIERALRCPDSKHKNFYSFEYFPARTPQGVENLIDRIERMGKTNPLWVDITWNAGGVTSDITLDLCCHVQ